MIVRNYGFPFSSATVRNILAELEEEGYLTHPYTSAGRIPTDKGYRFYVDCLMDVEKLREEEERRIQREYENRRKGLEDVMRQTSKMLSLISRYAGFILSPPLDRSFLKHIELVRLGDKRILVVFVSRSGLVTHRTIQLDYEPKQNELHKISKILNQRFFGLSICQMEEKLKTIIELESNRFLNLMEIVRNLVSQAFAYRESEIYLEGSANILAYAEEDSVNYAEVNSVFRAIEGRRFLADIVKRLVRNEGVKVLIGSESSYPQMMDLSVVASRYSCGNKVAGALGVIGPKRMEYPRIVALVDFISKVLDNVLNEGG